MNATEFLDGMLLVILPAASIYFVLSFVAAVYVSFNL